MIQREPGPTRDSTANTAASTRELLNEEVDAASLAVCTDALRSDLAPLCVPGSLHLSERRRPMSLATVVHAVDRLKGRLRPGCDAWDAIAATAAPVMVTGTPRALALPAIAALEASPRGWYGGLAVQVLAVAAGLGTIVERSITVFTVIKFCGALYLVYLGVQAIRHRRSLADAFAAGVEPVPLGRILREGFLVGVTNPKSIVLFTAILPQFVDPHGSAPQLQLVVLGGICLVIALLSDSIWALAAGSARAWFGRRPERLATVGGVGGLVTIGLGVRLALTGRHD